MPAGAGARGSCGLTRGGHVAMASSRRGGPHLRLRSLRVSPGHMGVCGVPRLSPGFAGWEKILQEGWLPVVRAWPGLG